MMTMDALVREAVDKGASDLHLSAGGPPRVRVDGDLVPTDHPTLSAAEVQALVDTIMTPEQRERFATDHELDFSWATPSAGRFRVNIFMQGRGPGAVLRAIPTVIPSFESLQLPPFLAELCKRERGLVLVTGPTGSGKSTTLAAMVDVVNSTWDAHILTIEDPVEFVHESKRCLVNQREVGAHTASFSTALRGALREDPDVILVGEMRDLETISLALTAAETGHLVFGTLHTSSAPKTVDRIIDVFPSGQQSQIRTMLAESLEAVVAQRLLKKVGGGRIAACEILTGSTAVRNLIREGKLHQIPSVMQTGQQQGMVTFDMAIADLQKRGLIAKDGTAAPPPRPPTNVNVHMTPAAAAS
jgi:twitching motility protein PilT